MFYFGYHATITVVFGSRHPTSAMIRQADDELLWFEAPARSQPVSLTKDSARVSKMQLVTPTSGWALTPEGLLWTSDGGTTWRDISPGSVSGHAPIAGVGFFGHHGWVMRERYQRQACSLVVDRTANNGKSWTRAIAAREPIDCSGDTVDISSPDARSVFAMAQCACLLGGGNLLASHDGGRTWEAPGQGTGGVITFISSTDGWATGGTTGPTPLWRTTTGGTTWSTQHIARPSNVRGQAYYTAPSFTSPTTGWLEVTYASSTSHVAWYHTTDRGNRWRLATVITVAGDASDRTVVSAVTPGDRLLTVLNRRLLSTANGHTSTIQLPHRVSSDTRAVTSLDFATPTLGWAQVAVGNCLDFKTDCINATLLYQTHDGGHTWQLLTPTFVSGQ